MLNRENPRNLQVLRNWAGAICLLLVLCTVGCGGGSLVGEFQQNAPPTTSPGGTIGGGAASVPPPTIGSVSPTSGPASGGTAITISGNNFDPKATVLVGGMSPATFQVMSATQIQATTAPHAAGPTDVQVMNPDTQRGVVLNAFTFTPVQPPSITAVSPNSGPSTGGTTLIVNGIDFLPGATVLVGGARATSITFVGPTQLQAITPGGFGAADVTVRNPDGQLSTLQAAFNYQLGLPPTITSVTPNQGPGGGGATVTIAGTNFIPGAAVIFGGVAVTSVSVISPTQISVITAAHVPGTVDVTVRNPDNQSATILRAYVFVPPPTVTSVSPSFGPSTGGTTVTVSGSNFVIGASVTFGGVAASSVAVVSSTQLSAVTSNGTAGTVDVQVQNPDGQTGVLARGYTYMAPAPPTITGALVPNSGPAAGGTSVTIGGTGFLSGASVAIGGIPATGVTVTSATQITAVTPAGSPGSFDVQVTNPDGQVAIRPNGFTYVPAPTVSSVTPSSGSTSGGTSVSISGTDFQAGATVQIGGVAATSVTFSNSTMLLATTPAHAAGAANVQVRNPDGQIGTLSNGFTYLVIPVITSISPAAGPPAGGTAVVITGGNFQTGATVQFGSTAATAVTVSSATQIQCTSPAGTPNTAVDITVRNPNNQSATLPVAFRYGVTPAPTITALSPTSGPAAGGTLVTVNGTNLQTGATVTFGGTPAQSVTVVSSTQIRAVTAAASGGTVNVTVLNPDGQSATVFSGYTYVPPPSVISVSPSGGISSGGTGVLIGGVGFQNGATVGFGGVAAASVTFNSPTQLTVVTPAHGVGAVNVTVQNPDAQSGTLAGGYTYLQNPAPTISSVSPNIGPSSGVTSANNKVSVSVNGSNFLSGAVVVFGGAAGTVTGVSPNQIAVQIPPHAAGPVNVVVQNPDGQFATLTNGFTYELPPTLTSISPNSGATTGGTSVNVTGNNFLAGILALLATTPANPTSFISATQIQAVTPSGSAGTVDVTVVNPDLQTATLTNGFSYTVRLPAPTLTTISPSTGPDTGGTTVVLTGTNFQTGATVTIGNAPATISNLSATQITAVTQASLAGTVNVTVLNPDGQLATLANGFSYTITSVPGAVKPVLPTPPQLQVDPTLPNTTGYTVVNVADTGNPATNGKNLQAALNSASCNPTGTIIRLQASGVFNGPITLPAKTCAPNQWIIVRSDSPDSNLPPAGTRIKPSFASFMPTILAAMVNQAGINAAISSQNYRLMFLQVRVPTTGYTDSAGSLIELGNGGFGGPQDTAAEQPSNIIVDRCLVRGSDSPPIGIRRGVELQCAFCGVVDSYIDKIHEVGIGDTQAVAGWNSTGPWLIQNNYLEAAGENILFGGADVNIPNAVPSDITIVRNHFFKPLSWRVGDPSYAGVHWGVKNLLELKLGVRVLIEGNIFENIWPDAQSGEAFGFYSSNPGKTPWAQVSDVEFRYNTVDNAVGGIGGAGCDNGIFPNTVSGCARRIYIHDNLMTNIGGASGRYVIFASNTAGTYQGSQDFFFEHNTVITTSPRPNSFIAAEGFVKAGFTPFVRFAFHNNIFGTQNGGSGDNCKIAGVAVFCWTEDAWHNNIAYGTSTTTCKAGTGFYPYARFAVQCPVTTIAGVGFNNVSTGDYSLAASSIGHNRATDGRDVGADIAAIKIKTAGVP